MFFTLYCCIIFFTTAESCCKSFTNLLTIHSLLWKKQLNYIYKLLETQVCSLSNSHVHIQMRNSKEIHLEARRIVPVPAFFTPYFLLTSYMHKEWRWRFEGFVQKAWKLAVRMFICFISWQSFIENWHFLLKNVQITARCLWPFLPPRQKLFQLTTLIRCITVWLHSAGEWRNIPCCSANTVYKYRLMVNYI